MLVKIYLGTPCVYISEICVTRIAIWNSRMGRNRSSVGLLMVMKLKRWAWPVPYEIYIYINNTWWIEFPPTSGDLYFLVCLVSQFDSPSPRVLVLSGREIGHLLSNRAGRIFSGNKFNSVLSSFEHLESIGFNLDLVRIWFNRDECRLFV